MGCFIFIVRRALCNLFGCGGWWGLANRGGWWLVCFSRFLGNGPLGLGEHGGCPLEGGTCRGTDHMGQWHGLRRLLVPRRGEGVPHTCRMTLIFRSFYGARPPTARGPPASGAACTTGPGLPFGTVVACPRVWCLLFRGRGWVGGGQSATLHASTLESYSMHAKNPSAHNEHPAPSNVSKRIV